MRAPTKFVLHVFRPIFQSSFLGSSLAHKHTCSLPNHSPCLAMDAFTVAPVLPIALDEPAEMIPVDNDDPGTSGSHSGCVIA